MGRDDGHGLRFPDVSRRRFDWRQLMAIAAVAMSLAYGAFYLYRNIQDEVAPGEGDLIVNVNTAMQSELETIPDIGPVLSRAIIAGCPYEKVEDLKRVCGIGSNRNLTLLTFPSAMSSRV